MVVTDDDIVEDGESFSAVLSVPLGETLVEIGTNSQALAEIVDNDRKFKCHFMMNMSKSLKQTIQHFALSRTYNRVGEQDVHCT